MLSLLLQTRARKEKVHLRRPSGPSGARSQPSGLAGAPARSRGAAVSTLLVLGMLVADGVKVGAGVAVGADGEAQSERVILTDAAPHSLRKERLRRQTG
jgi:hypothetical protein